MAWRWLWLQKKRGATKRNTSKLGQPTTANGNPPVANLGTKLNKNYENAIEAIENLIREKGTLSAHEFLHELDNALTGLNEGSTEGSDYIDIGDGFTIRVSDHYSNANTFKRFNNTEKNFGVVIKLKNRKFKSDPNVDYVEVVYYPDKLDSSRQLSILEGVKGLVETKDIGEMPEPDDTHTSEKTNYSLIPPQMDAAYLSAVERGDMETAQQMVMEAAKLTMPNTKVVDKNGNPKVVYHQTNHSVYINRETGQNWDELDWRERMEWDERDDWDDYWEEREYMREMAVEHYSSQPMSAADEALEERHLDVTSEIEKQAGVDSNATRLFWMLMIQIQGSVSYYRYVVWSKTQKAARRSPFVLARMN